MPHLQFSFSYIKKSDHSIGNLLCQYPIIDLDKFHFLLQYSTNFVMSPTLTSQGLVLATAVAVSAFLFDLLREKYFPPTSQTPQKQPLKSCLSSGSKKTEREAMMMMKKKKKKKVKFAEDVKDTKGNGELYRKEGRKWDEVEKSCGREIVGGQKIPANHAALYTGILRDRVHRLQYSY